MSCSLGKSGKWTLPISGKLWKVRSPEGPSCLAEEFPWTFLQQEASSSLGTCWPSIWHWTSMVEATGVPCMVKWVDELKKKVSRPWVEDRWGLGSWAQSFHWIWRRIFGCSRWMARLQVKVTSKTTSPWWFQPGSHMAPGSALSLLFSTSGPSPDAASYGSLVQTCCRVQEMGKAQELVKEAGSQGGLLRQVSQMYSLASPYLSIYPSIYLSIHLSIHLSIYLSIHLYLST